MGRGWANFQWDSPAGYGIMFAISVTLVSWVFVGWALWHDYSRKPSATQSRTAEGAKWLQRQCPGSTVGTVSEVNIYPVKSCAQLSVQEANVVASGLEGDHSCMVVTAADMNFLTQRENPKMVLITAEPSREGIGQTITLSAPEHGECTVKLDLDLPSRKATIWEEPVEVADQGDKVAAWLSSFLDREVRLVCLARGQVRPTSEKFAKGFQTGLSDGFPYHVLTEASVEALNKQLKEKVPTKRFRPNIVIKGTKPFAEDTWRVFRVGGRSGVVFENVKPCSRCQVPDVDPESGNKGTGEVRSLLNKKRKGRSIGVGPWGEGQVFFGQNAVCLTADHVGGTIKVGDTVEVLEYESKERIVGARSDLQKKNLEASAI